LKFPQKDQIDDMTWPNHALQRTAGGGSGHATTIQSFPSQARRSLSLGR